jgi:hypothetical protein
MGVSEAFVAISDGLEGRMAEGINVGRLVEFGSTSARDSIGVGGSIGAPSDGSRTVELTGESVLVWTTGDASLVVLATGDLITVGDGTFLVIAAPGIGGEGSNTAPVGVPPRSALCETDTGARARLSVPPPSVLPSAQPDSFPARSRSHPV